MDEPIEEMVQQYFELEQKILNRISELPYYNKDCECDDPNRFCIVDDDVVVCRCINCGGDIYW